MSNQFINPINKKLGKNWNNDSMVKCITLQDQTPVKTANRNKKDDYIKNNSIGIMPFEAGYSNNHLANSSSLRKILFLEKKSSRKDLSITFYQRQIKRRQEKYQNQLIQLEQKLQNQTATLEAQLINSMKKESDLDQDLGILENIHRKIENDDQLQDFRRQDFSQLSDLSVENLLKLKAQINLKTSNQMWRDQRIDVSQDYTPTNNQQSNNRSRQDSFLLDVTLQQYFTSRY